MISIPTALSQSCSLTVVQVVPQLGTLILQFTPLPQLRTVLGAPSTTFLEDSFFKTLVSIHREFHSKVANSHKRLALIGPFDPWEVLAQELPPEFAKMTILTTIPLYSTH